MQMWYLNLLRLLDWFFLLGRHGVSEMLRKRSKGKAQLLARFMES
jgi:hypothetical protein